MLKVFKVKMRKYNFFYSLNNLHEHENHNSKTSLAVYKFTEKICLNYIP